MLKKDLILTFGTLGLLAAVAITGAFCFWYLTCSRQLQNLQRDAAAVNRNRTMIQALAAECAEYSKRDSSIDPILLSVGMRAKPGSINTPTVR